MNDPKKIAQFDNTEIKEALTNTEGSTIGIDTFMQQRIDRIRVPSLSTIKTWTVEQGSVGKKQPSFVELDADNKPTLYETEVSKHRVVTNMPINNIKDISINASTLYGEPEEFVGYGLTPVNPIHRMQREKMPEGKIAGIIAVEQEDNSLAIGIRIPARGIKLTSTEEAIQYGHPDHDGFAIRPFIIKSEKEDASDKPWNERKGFATIVADGNTSRQVSAISLKIRPGVVMKDLNDGTFQVLGQPEPYTDLALSHVAEVAQIMPPLNLTYNLAARVQKVNDDQQAGIIPDVRGGTTATFSMQVLPTENDKRTLYRNQNFQPEARPGKTNLGKSFFISADGKTNESQLGTTTIIDPISMEQSNVLINDGGASKTFLLNNWWEYLKTNETFEANPMGIRVETSDGILNVKAPKKLLDLIASSSAETLADVLANEQVLNEIFELHPYDDGVLMITIPGELRKEIKPEKILKAQILIPLIRQSIQKVIEDEQELRKEPFVVQGIKDTKLIMEESISSSNSDGRLIKIATDLEYLFGEKAKLEATQKRVATVKPLLENNNANLLMSYAATLDVLEELKGIQSKGVNMGELLEIINTVISKGKAPKNYSKTLDYNNLQTVFEQLIDSRLVRLKDNTNSKQISELVKNISSKGNFQKLQNLLGTSAVVMTKELETHFKTGKSTSIETWSRSVSNAKDKLESYLG